MTTLIQNGDKRFISAIRQNTGMNEVANAMEELLCRVRNELTGKGDLVFKDSKKWVNEINNFMAFIVQKLEVLVIIKNTKSQSEEPAVKSARVRLRAKKGRGNGAYVEFKFHNKSRIEDAFQLIRESSLTRGHKAKAIDKEVYYIALDAKKDEKCAREIALKWSNGTLDEARRKKIEDLLARRAAQSASLKF